MTQNQQVFHHQLVFLIFKSKYFLVIRRNLKKEINLIYQKKYHKNIKAFIYGKNKKIF